MVKLYPLAEAAEMLHISPETLRKKVQPHGAWPARRLGKQILFTDDDLAVIVELAGQPEKTRAARRRRSAAL